MIANNNGLPATLGFSQYFRFSFDVSAPAYLIGMYPFRYANTSFVVSGVGAGNVLPPFPWVGLTVVASTANSVARQSG